MSNSIFINDDLLEYIGELYLISPQRMSMTFIQFLNTYMEKRPWIKNLHVYKSKF